MFESRHVGSSVLIRTVLKMVIYPCLLNLVPVVTYQNLPLSRYPFKAEIEESKYSETSSGRSNFNFIQKHKRTEIDMYQHCSLCIYICFFSRNPGSRL